MTHLIPTGQTRYRVFKRFLRTPLVVLQHEYRVRELIPLGGSGFFDESVYNVWRDASPEDVMVIPKSSAST